MSVDSIWMLRAVELARRGEGLTRPNPPVGAVVVKDGHKLAEGYHRRSGGLHAEVEALEAAGEEARGADIYVTLEPCSTYGKTPPCTEAIIAAGIRRAIVAVADPNPHHAGRGLEILRKAGIAVDLGLCEQEARELLDPFAKWILHQRPWVTLKLGMSVDGRIADRRGTSRWITGPEARSAVQGLRRAADVIMVGARTALADDPSLLPRPAHGRQPYRVVLSSRGGLPLDLKIFSDGRKDRTIAATTAAADPEWVAALEHRGVEVWKLPSKSERVSLKSLLGRMGGLGLLHLVCEGGGELAAELVEQNLVDEYRLFIAPAILGGGGLPAIAGSGWLLCNRRRLEFLEVRKFEDDIMIRARKR